MFLIEEQAKKNIIITNEHHQRMDKLGYIYEVKCYTAINKMR